MRFGDNGHLLYEKMLGTCSIDQSALDPSGLSVTDVSANLD
jgi:hypothetical protein